MGDPETEVVLPRIKTDLLDLFEAVANETLDKITLEVDERIATTVMLVSGGYPEDYEKGKIISGLDKTKDSIVFHAGTKLENGNVVTNGGRVIAVTSFGNTIEEAVEKSFKNAEIISYDKKQYRKDIGKDLMKLEKVK
jgi:phosphoribosylamine---glycine ligase